MIERLQGRVENISIIRHLKDNLDLCEIQIDFDTLKIFYDANELMQFINKDVTYTVRPDVVDGVATEVICELAILTTIQTVSSSENVKLIPEGNRRTMCNVEAKNLRFGEFYSNCIALMSKFEFGSSGKAKWFDCTMVDAVSKEFIVRLFTSNTERMEMEAILSTHLGRYNVFDVKYTKFGLQTEEFVCLDDTVEESPEVVVAKEIVANLINSDTALSEYNKRYDFINNMSSLIDGEPGYGLVRIASELYMINAIDSISTDLDIKAMKRAVVCSRGYLLPHKTAWSRPMLNVNKCMSIGELKSDKELMLILDVLSEEEASSTKQTYIKIRGLVNDIIKIRRGVSDEENSDSSNVINAAVNSLNGLL